MPLGCDPDVLKSKLTSRVAPSRTIAPSQCPASCAEEPNATGKRHKLPTRTEITRSTYKPVGMLQSLERLKPRSFGATGVVLPFCFSGWR